MTPIHINRLSQYSNTALHLSKQTNYFALIALKVIKISMIIIPMIAAIFIYLLFSGPTETDLMEPSEVSFNSLKLSPDDKNCIKFIVENLATKGKSELLMMSYKLSAQGNKINDVHPLKFMSYVFSEKKIKNDYLPLILSDKFKKMSFMSGLSKKLEKVNNDNLLKPYLVEFMNSSKIPLSKKNKLESLIDEKKWHDFFSFALKNSKRSSSLF